jgi:hypothetical protein
LLAGGRDSQYLPALTLQLQRRLMDNELRLQELLAGGGYSNGSNYAFLILISVSRSMPFNSTTAKYFFGLEN